jgi:hypothetical protein
MKPFLLVLAVVLLAVAGTLQLLGITALYPALVAFGLAAGFGAGLV